MFPITPTLHAAALDELVTMGMNLARALHADAMDASSPTPAQVASFDRVARTVRRTVLLARRLADLPSPQSRRTEARARVIREVEDAITREHGETEHADALRAELAERLDDPDLDPFAADDLLALRPLAALIADIRHDLGLDAAPAPAEPGAGAAQPPHQWQRRTPADLRALTRRAATPPPLPPGRRNLRPLPPDLLAVTRRPRDPASFDP